MTIDFDYLTLSLANLTGLPVRLYERGTFIKLYHHTAFKPDLAIRREVAMFANPADLSYYLDETFLIYGLLRVPARQLTLLIGPVTQKQVDRTSVTQILRSIAEPLTRQTELLNYLSALPSYPLRNFLQILCTIPLYPEWRKDQRQRSAPAR